MATTATFSDMIKEYMPYELLREEMKKRNWLFENIKKDESYMGGTLYVPFEGAEASSLSFGSLTASDDIAQATYVKGSVTSLPEMWGTMLFYEKDLDVHKNMEKSFLQILPRTINNFIDRMSERISLTLLNGNHIDKLSSDGADGSIVVYHPERFTIGEKIIIDDDDSATVEAYVTAINMSSKTLTIKDARSAGSNVDASGYTTVQNAKIYLPGASTASNVWTSLRGALLSSANGGDANLYGQTKTAYPFLQAVQVDGSAITASNILDKLYDAYTDVRTIAKGNANKIIVSYKNWKNIAKGLESGRQFTVSDKQAGYGWTSVTLIGISGPMEIIAVNDMDDDVIFLLEMDAFKLFGKEFFNRKRHGNNEEFYMTRTTSGYTYIVDVSFEAQLVVHAPSHCGVIHSISY